jgi:hypothetical protein
MATITHAGETRHREKFVCNCNGVCGVNKDHGEMRQAFLAKFGDTPEHRAIDARYRSWGKKLANGTF